MAARDRRPPDIPNNMRNEWHERKYPAHGVQEKPDRTTVVLVTVATNNRKAWCADDAIHAILRQVWTEACGWLVGYYMIMPDHLHYFVCPGELGCSLERWQHYWKHQFGILVNDTSLRFMDDHWDTRMRNGQHFTEKWAYVRNNPIRKELAINLDDWPYQGIIHNWIYTGP